MRLFQEAFLATDVRYKIKGDAFGQNSFHSMAVLFA